MKLGPLTFQCACLAWCMRSILSASRVFRMTMTSARVMAGRSFFVVYIALSPFEVMRAWSLSGAQECSRVRDISFRMRRYSNPRATCENSACTDDDPLFLHGYVQEGASGEHISQRPILGHSGRRAAEIRTLGQVGWGEGHSTSEPCAVAASKRCLRTDKGARSTLVRWTHGGRRRSPARTPRPRRPMGRSA